MSDATQTERGTDEPLHPRLQLIAGLLAEARAEMLAAAHEIPPALRAVRPAPDRWSAAEVVAHLAKVEDGAGRLFSKGAKVVRASGVPPESTDWSDAHALSMLDAFDRFGVRTRLKKFDAPPIVLPDASPDFDEACETLTATRARLLQSMQQASGLALDTFSAPHPRLGEMNLYEWLLLIARHEQRHALQLQEIRTFIADEYDV